MVKKVRSEISEWEAFVAADGHMSIGKRSRSEMADERVAARVLDAILPQVSTVEELEALPFLSRLIGTGGAIVTRHRWSVHVDCFLWVGGTTAKRALEEFGPLTVVWRPES